MVDFFLQKIILVVPLGYKHEDKKLVIDYSTKDIVVKIFELYSSYNNVAKYHGFNRSIVEYARIIPEERNATFINERVSKCKCCIHVNHRPNAQSMEIIHSLL